MIGKKKLSEIKAEVRAILKRLPDGWLDKEIKAAKKDPTRDAKTLEMLCAALEDEVKKKRRKPKPRQAVKR